MEAALKPLSTTAITDGSRIGETLRKIREERGLILADVARDTRIPLRHLTALEADQYDSLPARPYAIGFIRTYYNYLGLNPQEAIEQYKNVTYTSDTLNVGTTSEPLNESRLPSRAMVIGSILGVIVFIALAWIAYTYLRQSKETPVATASTDSATAPPASASQPPVLSQSAAPPVSATPAAPLVPTATPAIETSGPVSANPVMAQSANMLPPVAVPATNGTGGMVIHATEDSWIKVSDGGPVSFKIGILKAGDNYSVPALPGVKLTTGNAGGLELTYNGKALTSLGKKGELVRNYSLQQPSPTPLATH